MNDELENRNDDLDLNDDALDDVEPVVSDPNQLYEHFRVTVDKGQAPVRIDKYLFERIVNASRNRIQMAADAGYVMANGKTGEIELQGEAPGCAHRDDEPTSV